jgi:tetratricopeptide (TPR) repeat protein
MNSHMRNRGQILVLVGAVAFSGHGCASETASKPKGGYETVKTPPRRDAPRAEELHTQALAAMDAGNHAEAERLFKAALDADVTFGPAHNNLGKLYYQQDKHYLAAWEFEYAIKLMPNQPEPRNNLGMVFEDVGKLDEAVAHYEQALTLERDNPQLIGNLARAHIRRGDRGDDVRDLLTEVVMKDRRPDWVSWAKEQLALMGGPTRRPVRGLETQPSPID